MTTGTNQFVPFATGTGANVYSAAAFAGLPARATGVVNGIADGPTFNSAWRQGTSMSAMLGQFISAYGYDALDDGDIATLKAHFEAALGVMIAAGLPTIPSTSYIHVGAGGGTANAQTATVVPAITAYEDGHIFEITPAATSTSTTPTLAINGLSAKTVVHPDGTALVPGEIVAGAKVLLAYDATLGKMVLLGVTKPYVLAQLASLLPANALGYLRNNGSGTLSWKNLQDYAEAATAPSAPVDGDEWYDTVAGVLYKRIAGAWVRQGGGAALLASGAGPYAAGATIATLTGVTKYSSIRLIACWNAPYLATPSARGIKVDCSADAGTTYHRMTELYVHNGATVGNGGAYVDIIGLGRDNAAAVAGGISQGVAWAVGYDCYSGAIAEPGPYSNPTPDAGPFDTVKLTNSVNGTGNYNWAIYGI